MLYFWRGSNGCINIKVIKWQLTYRNAISANITEHILPFSQPFKFIPDFVLDDFSCEPQIKFVCSSTKIHITYFRLIVHILTRLFLYYSYLIILSLLYTEWIQFRSSSPYLFYWQDFEHVSSCYQWDWQIMTELHLC